MTRKPKDSGDGLADFVRGLPEGQRHNGFYWAINTGIEDKLPRAELQKITKAGEDVGLDEAYINRTVAEAEDD